MHKITKILPLSVFALAFTQSHAIIITNETAGVVDNSSTTRDLPFDAEFAAPGATVSSVTLSIFFAKHDGQVFLAPEDPLPTGNGYFSEIEFALTSPSGTTITLISNSGGVELIPEDASSSFNSPDLSYRGTINFDQPAAETVNIDRNEVPSGTFRPDDDLAGNLNSFIGEQPFGTWTLFIEDDVGADALSFYSASLDISVVPEPSAYALLAGLSGLALVVSRRRVN